MRTVFVVRGLGARDVPARSGHDAGTVQPDFSHSSLQQFPHHPNVSRLALSTRASVGGISLIAYANGRRFNVEN